MEKKIITGIGLIPMSSNPINAFRMADSLAGMIGHLIVKYKKMQHS